jgi:uncharacterized protein (TIGR04255 family)
VTRARPGLDYPNPPIEEGLCQFTFSEPLPWNVATPGLLFNRLRSEYAADPEEQLQMQASFESTPEAAGGANFAMNRGGSRYIYRDPSRTRLLVINSELMSVNSLKPYEGWDKLKVRLERGISQVSELISIPRIAKISLRYINRIVIGGDGAIDTDNYFTIPIHSGDEGKAALASFIHRVQSRFTDGRTVVTSTFATVDAAMGGRSFLLDLEFQRNYEEPITVEVAVREADELKAMENAEFETCITDETRKLFS